MHKSPCTERESSLLFTFSDTVECTLSSYVMHHRPVLPGWLLCTLSRSAACPADNRLSSFINFKASTLYLCYLFLLCPPSILLVSTFQLINCCTSQTDRTPWYYYIWSFPLRSARLGDFFNAVMCPQLF